jgi:endonuclease YncB( thermonuclease family)
MAFNYRRHPRPLWRSLVDLAAFLIVLTATIYLMQQSGMVDLGSSPVEIVDGDSLRREGQEIRLEGIDAPEYRQSCLDAQGADYACGRAARDALRAIINRRDVHCVSVDTDRFERAISTCKIGNLDVGAEMVRQGWAVVIRNSAYVPAEREARRARRGLWAGTFERPAEYRARMRVIQGSSASVGYESNPLPDD